MSEKENRLMLEWPSGLDDEILDELAFTARSRIEPVQSALILRGQVIGGRLVLSAPPGACVPGGVRDIEIRLSNAHIFVSLEPSVA